jgi:hypothetical protein
VLALLPLLETQLSGLHFWLEEWDELLELGPCSLALDRLYTLAHTGVQYLYQGVERATLLINHGASVLRCCDSCWSTIVVLRGVRRLIHYSAIIGFLLFDYQFGCPLRHNNNVFRGLGDLLNLAVRLYLSHFWSDWDLRQAIGLRSSQAASNWGSFLCCANFELSGLLDFSLLWFAVQITTWLILISLWERFSRTLLWSVPCWLMHLLVSYCLGLWECLNACRASKWSSLSLRFWFMLLKGLSVRDRGFCH